MDPGNATSRRRAPLVPPGGGDAESPPACLVAPLLEDPPDFPGWPLRRWRQLLGSARIAGPAPAALGDPRVRPLLAWAWWRSDPRCRQGAVAAVLVAIDSSLRDGERDPARLAKRIGVAVATARPLASRPLGQVRVTPSDGLERGAAEATPRRARGDSPLLAVAAALLRQAGTDLRANPSLADRLAAALDMAVDHWLAGAEAGGGLPEYRREHQRFYEHRLFTKLGSDRDLHRLLAGPQPGRGRDRQAAWQRGLTYWVASAMAARHSGQPMPVVPPKVIAHWRKELESLSTPPGRGEAVGLDSRYGATA
jgi:hypothetical protein